MATAKKATKTAADKPVTRTPAKAAAKPAAVKAPAAAKAAAKASAKPTSPAKPAKPKASPAKASRKAASPGKTVPAEQRAHYIEVAAFYIAERRGFAPGNPTEDWLAAEAEIDRLLAAGRLG